MENYLNLLTAIMIYGDKRRGRNAVTRALFARQLEWDLSQGFPVVTTKEIKFKSIVGELLWFLSGSTNDNDLKKIMGYPPEKRTIWTANATDFAVKGKALYDGDLGLIYGSQFRRWNGKAGPAYSVDQIAQLVKRLRDDPYSRYHLVTAWNPSDVPQMALPACHVMFQVFCHSDNGISLSMIQRSCDALLGIPYNITSYALLLCMLAQVTKRTPKRLSILFQDVHIYQEHFDAVSEQLKRDPYLLPRLKMNPAKTEIDDFVLGDFELENYHCHPAIKAPMIV